MKSLISFVAALLLTGVSFQSFAQGCSPNPVFANSGVGVYPSGIQMDCSGTNASATVIGLTDTTLGGLSTAYFDAMRVLAVEGLPAGLVVETDVMNSATAGSPFGVWAYSGSQPVFDPSVGCLNISGTAVDWAAAAIGGPNNDGVFPLKIIADYRIAYTDPDMTPLGVTNGEWLVNTALSIPADTIQAHLYVNQSSCGATLFVSTQVTANTDTTQGCDGSATVEVYNGQPPYTYSFSNGVVTPTASGLCPGTYTVDVVDANGEVGTAAFAVGVASNVYSNVNPIGFPPGLDSIFGSYQTCDLDYSLPIDSFMVTQAFTGGTDTLLVEWVVYQLGQPYTLLSFYPALGNNQAVVSLTLFCENGRSEAGVFQLYDYVDLDATGVEEQAQQLQFSVMPNPTSGLPTLQLDALVQQARVDVFDPTGKRVLSQNLSVAGNNQIDLQHLADGLYTLRVSTQHGFGVKRIVKAGGVR